MDGAKTGTHGILAQNHRIGFDDGGPYWIVFCICRCAGVAAVVGTFVGTAVFLSVGSGLCTYAQPPPVSRSALWLQCGYVSPQCIFKPIFSPL